MVPIPRLLDSPIPSFGDGGGSSGGGLMDWGALISSTLQLYRKAATEAWEKGLRSWWVALLPFLYGPLFFLCAAFTAPLGMIGGLITGLVLAVCVSSYLYYIAGVVNGNRMHLSELGESWRPHFGSVLNILFFLFLVQYSLAFLTPPGDETAMFLASLIELILLIILNPIPEIIYQGRSDGFAMLQESVDFLRSSGVEWFLPFIALAVFSAILLPLPLLEGPLQFGRLTFPTTVGGLPQGSLSSLLWGAVSAFLLFAIMVFRGLLFRALSGTTRRQRIFRSRVS